MDKLIISFDSLAKEKPINYVGGRPRQSTITSVVFLSPDTLACCHFNARCMFLVRFNFNNKSFQLLQKIDTIFNNQPCETDLMAGDNNGNLVTSNFFQGTCSLYKYENNHIQFVKDLSYNAGNRVHGTKFINNDIIAVTSRLSQTGIHFFNVNNSQQVALFSTPEPAVQDLCLLSNNVFAMIACYGTTSVSQKSIHSSRVSLVEYDLKNNSFVRIKERNFETSHLDNIVHNNGILYITDQYNNKVIRLNSQNLDLLDDLTGYSFPHGVDVNHGLVAVTNYGLNNIIIQSI
jgi:hypothetical protein